MSLDLCPAAGRGPPLCSSAAGRAALCGAGVKLLQVELAADPYQQGVLHGGLRVELE